MLNGNEPDDSFIAAAITDDKAPDHSAATKSGDQTKINPATNAIDVVLGSLVGDFKSAANPDADIPLMTAAFSTAAATEAKPEPKSAVEQAMNEKLIVKLEEKKGTVQGQSVTAETVKKDIKRNEELLKTAKAEAAATEQAPVPLPVQPFNRAALLGQGSFGAPTPAPTPAAENSQNKKDREAESNPAQIAFGVAFVEQTLFSVTGIKMNPQDVGVAIALQKFEKDTKLAADALKLNLEDKAEKAGILGRDHKLTPEQAAQLMAEGQIDPASVGELKNVIQQKPLTSAMKFS